MLKESFTTHKGDKFDLEDEVADLFGSEWALYSLNHPHDGIKVKGFDITVTKNWDGHTVLKGSVIDVNEPNNPDDDVVEKFRIILEKKGHNRAAEDNDYFGNRSNDVFTGTHGTFTGGADEGSFIFKLIDDRKQTFVVTDYEQGKDDIRLFSEDIGYVIGDRDFESGHQRGDDFVIRYGGDKIVFEDFTY